MKLSTLLVVGSLALNGALLAVYVSRTQSSSPVSGNLDNSGAAQSVGTTASGAASKPPVAAEKSKAALGAAPTKETWAKLNTGDLRALAARLRAAGFPPSVVRAVIYAQVNESFKSRREQLMPAGQEKPFWETDSSGRGGFDAKYYAALRDINREQTEIVKSILGSDATPGMGEVSDYQRRRFGELPQDRIDQLQRIEQDYNDLRNEVSLTARGVTLPEDREKLTMLEQEKRADLAKLLSPQEMEDYLTRTSTTTTRLRTALTTMDATEQEFRAIYQAQAAFDDKYNSPGIGMTFTGAEAMKERQAAQAQVSEQIKAALGDARYADYTRSSDREYQQLSRLAQQAALPETTARQMYDFRENTLKESTRIFEDASLTPEQKRASIQALAQTARTQISSTLGGDVGARYLQLANRWMGGLERGAAVTLNENGGIQIRNVPPGPGARPGGNPGPAGTPAGPAVAPAK